jgi:hypothetical protein
VSTGSDLRQVPGLGASSSGKHIEYEAAADRVRYQRHSDGVGFDLTVTARHNSVGGAVAVTVTVGAQPPATPAHS